MAPSAQLLQNEAAGNEVVVDLYKSIPGWRKWGGIFLHFVWMPLLAKFAWHMYPMYLEIGTPPMFPFLCLALYLVALTFWNIGKPGRARENLTLVKIGVSVHLVSFALNCLMAVKYHIHTPKDSLYPYVISRHRAVTEGANQAELFEQLETIEMCIESALFLVQGAAVYCLHIYLVKLIAQQKDREERVKLDAAMAAAGKKPAALPSPKPSKAAPASAAKPAPAPKVAAPASKAKAVDSGDDDGSSEDEGPVKAKGRGPVRRKA